LAGELSGEDLMSFELRLAGDAEFADEVEVMEALALGAKRSVLEDKMRMLQEVDSESVDSGQLIADSEGVESQQSMVDNVSERKETTIDHGPSTVGSGGKVRGLWKVLAVAASVGVIGLVFLMQMGNDELTVTPFPDMMTVRSVEKNQLSEAMAAYTSEKYTTALELFESIEDEDTMSEIYFYKSICALKIGQLSKAELYLSRADTERYPISFYQGMIDLKRGDEIGELTSFCECENCPPFLLSEISKYCLQ